MITLGGVIGGAGLSVFLEPHNLAPGGVSGIAIILGNFIPVPTGTLVFCLNIPLLALGLWKFGREFLFSTVYATIVFSASIDGAAWLFGPLISVTDDLLLSALFGGAVSALGAGHRLPDGLYDGGNGYHRQNSAVPLPAYQDGRLVSDRRSDNRDHLRHRLLRYRARDVCGGGDFGQRRGHGLCHLRRE